MTWETTVREEAAPAGELDPERATRRVGLIPVLLLSAWCGLVSGLLEVGAIVLRAHAPGGDHFYRISRHFVWLTPLLNLALFLVLGVVLGILIRCAPRRGRWLAGRLLCTLTVLPAVWAGFPGIYSEAGFLLALGIAARLVPSLERHAWGLRRLVRLSLPVAAGLVAAAAAALWGHDRIAEWREARRPFPPPGSPNVLLIVMDTVSAEHLSLHGYARSTSPTLEELASRGIRFDRMEATAPWTLTSHASMFTGRWPHELSAGWNTPLDATAPTLAEFLGSRGYATAGFVANSSYCGTDSGLARGFTEYRDYQFPRLTAFTTAVLVNRPVEKGLVELARFVESWPGFEVLIPALDDLFWYFTKNRKESAEVNREFLDWLSHRPQPERPFFAFLNYFDAHLPYEVPTKRQHRFGARARNPGEAIVTRDWLRVVMAGPRPWQLEFARDTYDDCVADLDEQLGCLIDELARRSLLERTWVVVTSDHGESFGEQPGVFAHGTSLYPAQVHVPLVIVPPAGGPPPAIVNEAASLRDLAATIVDVLGLQDRSPFPGTTLGRFWRRSSSQASAPAAAADPVLSEVVPLGASFEPDPAQWPLAAVTDGDWSFIRREEPVNEELYHTREDAHGQHNLAANPALKPMLERMRATLNRLTAGPLTPSRFQP
jgi:arylsulfatase A-like enzyme